MLILGGLTNQWDVSDQIFFFTQIWSCMHLEEYGALSLNWGNIFSRKWELKKHHHWSNHLCCQVRFLGKWVGKFCIWKCRSTVITYLQLWQQWVCSFYLSSFLPYLKPVFHTCENLNWQDCMAMRTYKHSRRLLTYSKPTDLFQQWVSHVWPVYTPLPLFLIPSKKLCSGTGRSLSEAGINWLWSLAERRPSRMYISGLSDILPYIWLKADAKPLFKMDPRWGLSSLTKAGRYESVPNSRRFPSIKLLKVEQSSESQCSPWEALPCFLSLTWLCNGKSIWLHSLFVFGSKSCPVFVHTDMHFSFYCSFPFVCFSCWAPNICILNTQNKWESVFIGHNKAQRWICWNRKLSWSEFF